MKRKISLHSSKSASYLYSAFLKQFRKALEHNSIGELLNHSQVLAALKYMGFTEEDSTQQDIELAKTIARMLAEPGTRAVRRLNLFRFLAVLCDIGEANESAHASEFEEEVSGLAMDYEEQQQPLIVIDLGHIDPQGRWTCTQEEKQQIRTIFASMKAKRISRQDVEARRRDPREEEPRETFQPKICTKSSNIVESKIRANKLDVRVENRLLRSRQTYNAKIQCELNKSIEKQLEGCTFKPVINRSRSKQNIPLRSSSQDHLRTLLNKGEAYNNKKQRLKQLRLQLNESLDMSECSFKPQTTKYCHSTKWAYVRNKEKQIQRLRSGHKQREFANTVKSRGYPAGINWSQYIANKSAMDSAAANAPILCLDFKMLNNNHNVQVYEGERISDIAARISRDRDIPQHVWWKIEEIIGRAVQQCPDIRVEGNRIFSCH